MKNLLISIICSIVLLSLITSCSSSEDKGKKRRSTKKQKNAPAPQRDKEASVRIMPQFKVHRGFQSMLNEGKWAKTKGFINDIIKDGKTVDIRDEEGRTPLFYAIKNGDFPLVKKLIRKKADINIATFSEGTPIFAAVDLLWEKKDFHETYKVSVDILRYLIARDADLNARMFNDKYKNCVACPEGITPLHYAIYDCTNEVIDILIRNGAKVNARNKYEQTPLHFASILGKADAMKLLIKRKADVNAHDKDLLTSLHYSVKLANLETTEILIKKSAKLTAKDVRGRTPLHFLFHNYSDFNELKKLAVLEVLMKSKANVYIRDKTNISFMNIARAVEKKNKNTEMAYFLRRKVFIKKPSRKRVSHIVWKEDGKAEYVYEKVSATERYQESTDPYDEYKGYTFTKPTTTTTTTSTTATTYTKPKDLTGAKEKGYGVSEVFSIDGTTKKYTNKDGKEVAVPAYGISDEVISQPGYGTSSTVSQPAQPELKYGISQETVKQPSYGIGTISNSSVPTNSGVTYGISDEKPSSTPSSSGVNYGISSQTTSNSTYKTTTPNSSGQTIQYGISDDPPTKVYSTPASSSGSNY